MVALEISFDRRVILPRLLLLHIRMTFSCCLLRVLVIEKKKKSFPFGVALIKLSWNHNLGFRPKKYRERGIEFDRLSELTRNRKARSAPPLSIWRNPLLANETKIQSPRSSKENEKPWCISGTLKSINWFLEISTLRLFNNLSCSYIKVRDAAPAINLYVS